MTDRDGAAARSTRLYSLDALRGLTVAAMVLVNNPGDWSHVYAPLLHAAWNGWTFTDTIFPAFLFIAGVSMVISVQRSLASNSRPAVLRRLAQRALIIIAIGFALNLVPSFDFATVRWPGVLQRIGLCILIAAPMVLWLGGRGLVAMAVLLMALYSALMLWVPVPDADGVLHRGALEAGRDTGAFVDRWLMSGHLWAHSKTWDPEGLLSTLPAVATLLFGALAGRLLRQAPLTARQTFMLALAGVAGLALGLLLDQVLMPINKSLWTPSYALFMSGLTAIALAVCYWLADGTGHAALRNGVRALLLPGVMFGVNALAIFALSGLVVRVLGAVKIATAAGSVVTPLGWAMDQIRRLPLDANDASLLHAVLFLLAMFIVAWFMWRKQIIIKV